jgi:predicted lipoprotein
MSLSKRSVFFVVLCLSATGARAEADHAAVAQAALKNYIRPGYTQFAESAALLDKSVAALCQGPSAAALEDARSAFAGTVAAWSMVEPIRFGPVEQEHRHDRIFYWPDPKGLGTRQLREALAKEDKSVAESASLAAKSVALQGLPALEYLLYGDDADLLAKPGGEATFRCTFARSVAANLVSLSKEVAGGWQDGAPYAKAYLAPAPDNSAYHAPKEVTLDLFKTFGAGIEWVRDQKLAKTLGASAEEARPKLAPFWRSHLSFANMAGNLAGVRDLFAKGGFAQIVHAESAGVEDSILFDLNHAIDTLSGIGEPVEQAVREEETRAKLEALRVSLKSAAGTAGDMIGRGADLSFGFNATDGD